MSKTKRPNNSKTANHTSEQKQPEEGINQFLERQAIGKRMSLIDKKILVLSGKGGVGKSMIAVNLAALLSSMGKRVGLLDIDIHGPSIPMMLHLGQAPPEIKNETIYPVQFAENLKVISIGFLLQQDHDAVIWRGPLKMGVIKQFLKDVEWGELDYLIIDSPPGTGDEPLSICQLIQNPIGAVLVTTPQDVAVIDVKKAITFCRKLRVPVLGVIENMSSLTCPRCGTKITCSNRAVAERWQPRWGCLSWEKSLWTLKW